VLNTCFVVRRENDSDESGVEADSDHDTGIEVDSERFLPPHFCPDVSVCVKYVLCCT
jgi:hypothetical protein